MRFIAFDLETTGTVAGVDQVAEIGAVRFVNGVPDAIFATLIDPGIPMPEAAGRVNGITDEMLKGKPKISEILEPFTAFCGDDILVAHNASFDTQFLVSDYKKHEVTAPSGVILDTYGIAKKVFPGLMNHKLSTLIQTLNLDSGGYHRAEQDAVYCGQLLVKIIEKLTVNGNAPTLSYLISLTGKPESRFPQITKQPKQLNLLDMF